MTIQVDSELCARIITARIAAGAPVGAATLRAYLGGAEWIDLEVTPARHAALQANLAGEETINDYLRRRWGLPARGGA